MTTIDALSPGGARISSLDSVRGCAVLLVLARHLILPPDHLNPLVSGIIHTLMRGSWIGADILYVLSGFLIFAKFKNERQTTGNIDTVKFIARRLLRLLPPLYILVTFTVVGKSLAGKPVDVQIVLSDLFLMQNYTGTLWYQLWALALEAHWYLAAALVALLAGRKNNTRTGQILLYTLFSVTIVGLPLLRLQNSVSNPFSHTTHLFPTHLRLDTFAWGALLCSLYLQRGRINSHSHSLSWIAVLPVSVCLLSLSYFLTFENSLFLQSFGLSAIALGAGLFVISMISVPWPCGPFRRTLGFLGVHGYSIYLWQITVKLWAIPAFERLTGMRLPYSVSIVFFILGSIAVGVVMSLLVEFPVARIRQHLLAGGRKVE